MVKLWDGVLALPIIGPLDSSRTQTIMESLLERIVETGSELAIIDITGVPTVDTDLDMKPARTRRRAWQWSFSCIGCGANRQARRSPRLIS